MVEPIRNRQSRPPNESRRLGGEFGNETARSRVFESRRIWRCWLRQVGSNDISTTPHPQHSETKHGILAGCDSSPLERFNLVVIFATGTRRYRGGRSLPRARDWDPCFEHRVSRKLPACSRNHRHSLLGHCRVTLCPSQSQNEELIQNEITHDM